MEPNANDTMNVEEYTAQETRDITPEQEAINEKIIIMAIDLMETISDRLDKNSTVFDIRTALDYAVAEKYCCDGTYNEDELMLAVKAAGLVRYASDDILEMLSKVSAKTKMFSIWDDTIRAAFIKREREKATTEENVDEVERIIADTEKVIDDLEKEQAEDSTDDEEDDTDSDSEE